LLGLDLGTTGCKAYAISYEGELLAEVSRSYELTFPGPGLVEQNPEDWWRAAVYCIKELSVGKGLEITSISLSSQANTLVLMGSEGKALTTAISWLDQRSVREVDEMVNVFGDEELHSKTGMMPGAGFTAPKLLWIRKHRRDLLVKAKAILFSPQSYVAYKLTGKYLVDRSLASFSMLYDIWSKKWFSEVLDFIGVDESLLPDLLYSCELAGYVKKEVSSKLGFKNEVPMVIGAHDQCCAALGAGVIAPGPVVDSTGTASAIIYVTDTLPRKVPRELFVYHYVVRDKWTLLGTLSASGALVDWFLGLFTEFGTNVSHEALEEEARKIIAGSEGVFIIPYFSGSLRPGIPHYARGSILGLTLSHGAPHIYRAIMEAIAFELKYYLEVIRSLNYPIRRAISVGGGAKSRLWKEIKANVFNLPVAKPRITNTAPLGACILAGIGAGVYRSLEEAAKLVRAEEEIGPDKGLVEVYDQLYKQYLILSDKASRLLLA